MAFCPYCGSEIAESAKFCTQCGARLTQSVPAQEEPAEFVYTESIPPLPEQSAAQSEAPHAEKRKKKSKAPLVIGIIAGVLVLPPCFGG